jgi:hypothetical protein
LQLRCVSVVWKVSRLQLSGLEQAALVPRGSAVRVRRGGGQRAQLERVYRVTLPGVFARGICGEVASRFGALPCWGQEAGEEGLRERVAPGRAVERKRVKVEWSLALQVTSVLARVCLQGSATE